MSNELKQQVQDLLEGKPAKIGQLKEVIKLVLMHTGKVTSDDVRFFVDEFDPSSMIVGMAFKQLVEDGSLKKEGTTKTDLKSSKSRDIAVYVSP